MLLAEVGIVLITLGVDGRGALQLPPRILTRGVVWEDQERDLLVDISARVEDAVQAIVLPREDDVLRDAACRAARKYLRDELGFRPLTHCVVTRSPG
jgi:hypothetical protein